MSTAKERQQAMTAFLNLVEAMEPVLDPDDADVSDRCMDDRSLHTGSQNFAESCDACMCEFTEKAQIAAIDYAHFAAVAGVE